MIIESVFFCKKIQNVVLVFARYRARAGALPPEAQRSSPLHLPVDEAVRAYEGRG